MDSLEVDSLARGSPMVDSPGRNNQPPETVVPMTSPDLPPHAGLDAFVKL